MPISPSTRTALADLAALLVVEDSTPFVHPDHGWAERGIPSSVLTNSDVEGASVLIITGETYQAFRTALQRLQGEDQLEHLLDKDIDASLWEFVCDLFIQKNRFRQIQERNQRIRQYLDTVVRPHKDYEVVIPLELLSIKAPWDFDGVRFQEWTQEDHDAWQFGQNEAARDFVGKPVASTTVAAGDEDHAVLRAQVKVDRALDLMRFGLITSIFIRSRDSEHLYRQGDRQLVRIGNNRWTKWNFSHHPSMATLDDQSTKSAQEYLQPLTALLSPDARSKKIQERFRLALRWFSSSVRKLNFDEKVIDLCTGLEALFAEKSDARKGELIALRAMLLQLVATGGFWDTFPLLRLYELRSSLVHGSSIGICGDAHYRVLLSDLERLLTMAAKFFVANPEVTTFAKFRAKLETRENLDVARQWFTLLGAYPEAQSLLAVIDRLLEAHRQTR